MIYMKNVGWCGPDYSELQVRFTNYSTEEPGFITLLLKGRTSVVDIELNREQCKFLANQLLAALNVDTTTETVPMISGSLVE
jgi:hypothetical protein